MTFIERVNEITTELEIRMDNLDRQIIDLNDLKTPKKTIKKELILSLHIEMNLLAERIELIEELAGINR